MTRVLRNVAYYSFLFTILFYIVLFPFFDNSIVPYDPDFLQKWVMGRVFCESDSMSLVLAHHFLPKHFPVVPVLHVLYHHPSHHCKAPQPASRQVVCGPHQALPAVPLLLPRLPSARPGHRVVQGLVCLFSNTILLFHVHSRLLSLSRSLYIRKQNLFARALRLARRLLAPPDLLHELLVAQPHRRLRLQQLADAERLRRALRALASLRLPRLLLALAIVLPLMRQLVDLLQRPRRHARRHRDVEVAREGLHHVLRVRRQRQAVVLHHAPDVAQLRLDALQPQLLADQLLLRAELGLLRGRELLVEGPDELADAGVHELGGQDRVDFHAGGGEAERDVGHRVAQRGGGVVGQRLGRVDEEAVRGVVGGGEPAEGAAVQQHAELLVVGGVLQRLDAQQLGERRFGVRDGDLLDGDAVEQAAVVGQDELQLGLAVRKGEKGKPSPRRRPAGRWRRI